MHFLTRDLCQRWASQRGWSSSPPDSRELEKTGWLSIHFTIPTDAGRRVALARALWQRLPTTFPRLVWVTEWGVWGSGEHMPLYTALRQALGDERALSDAPGHAVDSHEADQGLSVVVVAILFLWDVWILTDSEAALFLSHDEWGVFLSRDPEVATSAKEILMAFSEPAA